jgi:isoquinoline 1-oxidoreductase
MTEERSLELTRRNLLKALGGGLLMAAFAPDAIAIAANQRGAQIPQQISAWLHIAPDGRITVFTGKVEVGQNARTSITQAAAEELRVPVEQVAVVMGDTDLVPFDMGTFGSRTTPTMVPEVRRAAAGARKALIEDAAKMWGLSADSLDAQDGIVSGGGRRASYGELAKTHPIDGPVDPGIALTPADKWKVLGTSVKKIDGRDFVTGRHLYTSDLSRPGMLHAKILRPPQFGATLTSADTREAEAMPGVKVVHEGDFVAVAAPTVRLSEKALDSIKAEWKAPGQQPTSETVHSVLRGTAPVAPPPDGWPKGDKLLSATYKCPFIAHVPLEPRAALADWDGAKMTVHTGTQRPFGVKEEVASALGIPADKVRVVVPDTGSGYGGKHAGDAAVEAARIAKALNLPVKLVWTREEEFTFAYFRPAGVIEAIASIDATGHLSGWTFDNFNSGGAAIGTPYEVANKRIVFHEAESPLRQGSYRGLAATFNNFARETHIDELASVAGLDPVEFRLRNLKNERLIAVLTAAAKKFGWGAKPEANHGYGIACGTEKGSYLATATEVSVDPKTKGITVVRAVTAYECGAILNPDLLLNQVTGAMIMGLGGALFEAIEFGDAKIKTNSLWRYRVPRYSDIPKIEVELIDRRDIPSAGAGEAPIMGIAPAIGAAVYQATGVRLRTLPLNLPHAEQSLT